MDEHTTEISAEKEKNFFAELLKASLIALIIVVPIRFFIAQPFVVSGASMDPSFGSGNYLVVDQLTYRFDDPERGDVIIFHYPKDPSKFFIKRVIGLPGETILVDRGIVSVINAQRPDGFKLEESYVIEDNRSRETFRYTVGKDELFVMGDNRRASSDSRMWGPLSMELVVGRAFLRILPIGEATLLPGV